MLNTPKILTGRQRDFSTPKKACQIQRTTPLIFPSSLSGPPPNSSPRGFCLSLFGLSIITTRNSYSPSKLSLHPPSLSPGALRSAFVSQAFTLHFSPKTPVQDRAHFHFNSLLSTPLELLSLELLLTPAMAKRTSPSPPLLFLLQDSSASWLGESAPAFSDSCALRRERKKKEAEILHD